MRTDVQLQADVAEELRWDPSVSEKEITVAVESAIATLTGSVPTYAEKIAARHAAERVSGVRAVADELVVVAASSSLERTDAQIAAAAAMALDLHVQVPVERIRMSVSDGWIVLEGSVPWQFQRDAAAAAVRVLAGVRGVSNYIEVQPPVATPADVSHRIENALRRSAELDCKHIVVQIADGQVTLRGTVRSWAERQDAERAAWSAPGVRAVIDRLLVAS
jgi:osmotically-inducible protein OsmY